MKQLIVISIKGICIYAIYYAISYLLAQLFVLILPKGHSVESILTETIWASVCQYTVVLILVLIIEYSNFKRDYFDLPRISWVKLLIITFTCFGTFILINPIYWLEEISSGKSITIIKDNLPDKTKYILISSIYLVLFVPIIEEIIFRKWILGEFNKKGNYVLYGLLFSTLLFSLIHDSNSGILAAFISGIIMGLIYLKYGLIYSIYFHFLSNIQWVLVKLNKDFYYMVIKYLNFGFIYWSFYTISLVLLCAFILSCKTYIHLPDKK